MNRDRGLVGAVPPLPPPPASYTDRERANIDLVLALRAAPFEERRRYTHPDMRRHRNGFGHLAHAYAARAEGPGYTASTISDRVDTVEDVIAKDDRVWAVWTLRGTHTGPLFGIPATGRRVEVLEVGIWRIEDGLVAEAWFFGDELGLLRQIGAVPGAG
ncbi:ester cyclase [Nocardiopsis sp. NPDC050513]|uniref:ester cyclase n=1 Tax=Nocardiopsis sp. NPDC050513 TaxID=3364338 RepID=UPI0037B15FC8